MGSIRPNHLWLALSLSCGCLPTNPIDDTGATSSPSSTSTSDESSGEPEGGLFACEGASACTFLIAAQTLDDRLDVYELSDTPTLRGRIGVDLKPDPTGLQIDGNLLDEPYGVVLADQALHVLVGHYPATESGSLLTFPLASLVADAIGGVIPASAYFDGAGGFTGGVGALPLAQQEAIFAVLHPSGRLLVGVFGNDLRALDWSKPGKLLIVEPAGGALEGRIGAFDLGGLDVPCLGAWGLSAVAGNRVALACDGSESVALLNLPSGLGASDPASEAAAITGCGAKLASGSAWTTRFIAPDGSGAKFLAVQSQILNPPRLWTIDSACAAVPSAAGVAPGFEELRVFNEVRLLRAASGGEPASWLLAASDPMAGVYVIRGGASPSVCGRVDGLDSILSAGNAPYSLAIDEEGAHVAIGAGPPNNPELAEGRGQILWATLDTTKLSECAVSVSSVIDLNAGRFAAGAPETWVRAPNVLTLGRRGGGEGG
ncbi:MAG: hypothetical protein IPK80_08795 [Nannocystis sp.]|nr:hypothetical protein [Nannocystis sp.]